ncbi:MAG: hemolysin activator protein [Rickettsiaceae bacterium]|jgi:hemolysin activation/secretion protein|nr:hemolysin activator protein [Rickettsiaceae bacterium]
MTKNKFYFPILFLIAMFLGQDVYAQQNQDIINQQDWISRQQQRKIEEEKRAQEQENIKKERNRKKEDGKNTQKNLPVNGASPSCFFINEINLMGANSLSDFEKKRLVAPFIGKCMTQEALAEVVRKVNSYYQSKGYITTQVIVPQQNLTNGVFELEIIEGRIENISLGKDRMIEDMREFTAFGTVEGDVLNINDINQGVYQLNRLPSSHAVMKIEPGTESGYSKIVLDDNRTFPARFSANKDNLGNKFTGIQRTNFTSNFDNLLFLNDSLNLGYTANFHDDNQIKDLKAFSGGLSIPFAYNTFSYDYSRSEFRGQNAGISGPISLTGFSEQNKFGADRVLFNNTSLRLAADTSLTVKRSASYINGSKISTSERRLSVADFGFSLSSYLSDTTNIYLKPSYSRGLKIMNAEQDEANEPSSNPKSQFEVFKLYASASKRLAIPKLNAPLILSSEMTGQFSKDTLFGTEQISVGGYYSVRGFREDYINGDSGYYFRNKANVNIGSLAASLINNQDSIYAIALNKFKLEPFYDYGYARNKYDGSDGRLSGAGIKTIFDSKYLNASLTYAAAISKSKLITSLERENKMLYFEVGVGIN